MPSIDWPALARPSVRIASVRFLSDSHRKRGEAILSLAANHMTRAGSWLGLIPPKQTEQERMQLASLVEASTDFIGMASPGGRVWFVNPAGRSIVGLSAGDDVTRTTIADYTAYTERDRLRDEILPSLWRDSRWEGETLFRNFRTEETVPMWQHVFFVTEGDQQRRIALATVSRDLSERKRAAEKFAEAQAQLAHLGRVNTLGELAATIAHEVNQPLAAVVADAEACRRWLASDLVDLSEARAAAARIVDEGRRASEILARIRTLLERSPTRIERVDLNKIVIKVLDLVRSRLTRQDISPHTALAADLPEIAADPVQIEQVLLNLIVNAMEAIAERPVGRREITISSRPLPHEGVLISVRDTGIGINPAHFGGLFTPFQTTKPHGLGMGLSISRSIIEAHGGRIWASPNQGPGATFQFSIPARIPVS